jgi:hypothetical protein
MAIYQVLFWHGIPVQVRARGEGGRAGMALASRFQEAIDQAAMSAGLIGSDAYSEAFTWGDPADRSGTSQAVAAAVAAEIEAEYPEIDWRAAVERIRAG